MTTFVFANNVNTTLATAINSSATSVTLASSANLPSSIPAGSYFVITLNDAATRQVFEVMYATAVSGSTLTVLRGQEGTTAQSWLVGDYIYSGPTSGQMGSLGQGFANPMTAAGDLIIGGYLGAPTRLALGANGYVLTSNGTTVTWTALATVTGVTSFNTRVGAVTLNGTDVTNALGYTPFSNTGGTISGATTINSTLSTSGTATLNALNVSTTAAITGNATIGGNLTVTGTSYLNASDRRIKSNIQPITDALQTVEKAFIGAEYDMDGFHSSGFIAQDVEQVLPHLVQISRHGDFDDFRTLNYMGIIPYLANAIVELHAIVRKQALEIEALK